jgi:hypothetical protein
MHDSQQVPGDVHLPPGGAGWICLFSPETWDLAKESGFAQIAFPHSREKTAKRIRVGDIIICYVSQRMALSGILCVDSQCTTDRDNSIYKQAGEYPVIGTTSPLYILSRQREVPLRPHVRSFAMFRGISTPSGWTVALRRSPKEISRADLNKFLSLIMSTT